MIIDVIIDVGGIYFQEPPNLKMMKKAAYLCRDKK
jgi:hypothetical protein